MQTYMYRIAIQEAADLVSEHGENPEYDRGVYELLAGLFGMLDVPTDERAAMIEADVRAIKPILA